jgi:hypothetical protein
VLEANVRRLDGLQRRHGWRREADRQLHELRKATRELPEQRSRTHAQDGRILLDKVRLAERDERLEQGLLGLGILAGRRVDQRLDEDVHCLGADVGLPVAGEALEADERRPLALAALGSGRLDALDELGNRLIGRLLGGSVALKGRVGRRGRREELLREGVEVHPRRPAWRRVRRDESGGGKGAGRGWPRRSKCGRTAERSDRSVEQVRSGRTQCWFCRGREVLDGCRGPVLVHLVASTLGRRRRRPLAAISCRLRGRVRASAGTCDKSVPGHPGLSLTPQTDSLPCSRA